MKYTDDVTLLNTENAKTCSVCDGKCQKARLGKPPQNHHKVINQRHVLSFAKSKTGIFP